MAEFSSIVIDGDLKRIYEVPPNSSYIVDGGGYRIYTPDDIPTAPVVTVLDAQKDIWSRCIDWWANGNDWTYFPIIRSGGASRGFDVYGDEQFQSVDFNLKVAEGWKFVIADYRHLLLIDGNFFSNSPDPFDDIARLTAIATMRVNSSAELLTTKIAVGSGLSVEENAAVMQTSADAKLTRQHIRNKAIKRENPDGSKEFDIMDDNKTTLIETVTNSPDGMTRDVI